MSLLTWVKEKFQANDNHGPLDDYWYASTGIRSGSGIPVRAETALRLSAVMACVKVLAEGVASLPIEIIQTFPDGSTKPARNHPLWDLIHDQPNDYQTAFEFKEMMQGHATLRGNAYAEMIPGPRGFVDSLIPFHPDMVTPELLTNGRLRFRVRDVQGLNERVLTQDQVFHLKGLSANGLLGLSPVAHAAEAIGLGLATEEHGARLFSNGAQPGGVLEHPGVLGSEAADRLKKQFDKRHSGVSNAHKTLVLEEGLKYTKLGMTSKEAQFIDTRQYQVTEIARIFRVPPHMIGDLTKSSFNNIETQSVEFVKYTLRPWLCRWEQAIEKDMILFPKIYSAKFDVEELLRGDIKTRYEAYNSAITTGWLTRNEARRRENLNPLPGLDDPMEQLNMAPAGSRGGKDQAQSNHRPLFIDAAGRCVRAEMREVAKADNKKVFYARHSVFMEKTLSAVCEALTGKRGPKRLIKVYLENPDFMGESANEKTEYLADLLQGYIDY